MNTLTHTNIQQGLTTEEVILLPKNIPAQQETSLQLAIKIMKNQIFSFFFFLLIVSGILSLFLGESIDAIIFFGIALVNACIGFFQEYRANTSVRSLESLIEQNTTVRRNGEIHIIPSTEIVVGDIVLCNPGDVIVADMVVRVAEDLYVDESILTGESLPRSVEQGSTVLSGVSVVQGKLTGQVIAVGKESSLLQYADQVARIKKNNSFDSFISSISMYILILTVVSLSIILVVNVLGTHVLTFSEYILYAISVLVGVVPESLPLIITIILTKGVVELSRNQVIVKKISALQNLGSMNYLFTDKTGTITENSLHVKDVVDVDDLTPILHSMTASSYDRTPMDSVFDEAIKSFIQEESSIGADNIHTLQGVRLTSPFTNIRGYAIYTFENGQEIIRGQYLRVLDVCAGDVSVLRSESFEFESKGLRIIAFASRENSESEFTMSGVVVFEDPLKEDAAKTYTGIQNMGVGVKIMTGDSVPVATYVGNILDKTIDTESIYSMDDWDRKKRENINGYRMYARCQPDDKSELINQHIGNNTVGFLGEGINDALALRRADIGFVVHNASDIARQASDVILLEKSLSPVLTAIRISRRAFIHIRTYLFCTLAGNIGTLISLTAVVVFWQQIPMLPIQILLNNLLTDIPLMFIITDRVSGYSIKSPIRDKPKTFFKLIFLFAFIGSLFDFIFFFVFKGYDISVLRTGWFIFSVITELLLAISLRTELSIFKASRPSKMLTIALITCGIFTLTLPFLPFGSFFHLVTLSSTHIGLLIGIALVYLLVTEIIKQKVFKK